VNIASRTGRDSEGPFEHRVDDLPLLPGAVVRVMALSYDSENLFEDVLEVASEDPALAVRVLKMANSAMSSPVAPIDSLERAVARLGATNVAELVTAAAVTRVFVPTSLGERNLWHHAIEVATACRLMLSDRPTKGADPGAAYLAGLLHDIGRLVMFDQSPAFIQAVDDLAWSTPGELVEAERRVVGADHATIGARVCEHWQVPEATTGTVRDHHRDLSEADPPILAVVKQADWLSIAAHAGSPPADSPGSRLTLPPAELEVISKDLRFDERQLLSMIPQITEASRRAAAALSLPPD